MLGLRQSRYGSMKALGTPPFLFFLAPLLTELLKTVVLNEGSYNILVWNIFHKQKV